MIDLSTAAGALRFAELRRAEMAACFERRGRFESAEGFSFCAFVFATHAIAGLERGPKLPRVEPRLCDLPRGFRDVIHPHDQSAVFGDFVRSYAKIAGAVGVIVMTEAWSVSTPVEPGLSVQEHRDTLPARLEHADGRIETLDLWLTHRATGERSWRAEIHRDPTRLAPWVARSVSPVSGRLVNLVDLGAGS